jgi:hypothetical protein
LRALGLAGAAGGTALLFASPANARSEITPYIEVSQVLEADLDGGDTLTYTDVAAGVDATIETRRVVATVAYRYDRHIGWSDSDVDEDFHSGIAQARLTVADDLLYLDAGGIAARSRVDPRGSVLPFDSANNDNTADVYGFYAGPTLSTHIGPVAVNGSYHFGYVNVDDGVFEDSGLPGSSIDHSQSSTSHNLTGSIGMGAGELPFGWTVSAGYLHEDTNRLDQEFDDWFVRGDVVVPLSSSFAVTGGIGYEDIKSTSDDFIRDGSGLPVLDPDGDLISDPSKPRLLAYDQDGIIWDVGVIWRPNPRTEITARVGERYGDMTYVGTLSYAFGETWGASAVVYDSVTSFGQLVVTDVSGLPTKFKIDHKGLNGKFGSLGGCVYGNDPGSGRCFDDAFQSVTSSTFRNRGIGLLLSGTSGPWDLSFGAGYANRKYLAADTGIFSLHNVTDESWMIEATASRELSRTSGLDLDVYASWFDTELGGDSSFSTGATATYYRSFLVDRLELEISAGIYRTESGDFDSSTILAGLLGLSYAF